MILLQTLPPVVCAVPRLPICVFGLRELPVPTCVPGFAGGFDFFEVAVRVALDLGFGVVFLLGEAAGLVGHFGGWGGGAEVTGTGCDSKCWDWSDCD